MPVIKKGSSKPLIKDAIVLDMGDLQKQARDIIADAQVKADAIVKEAEEKAQALSDQVHAEAENLGHEKGFAAGHAEGLKQGHEQAYQDAGAQIKAVTDAWQHGSEQWENELHQIHRLAYQSVLDTAINMAYKVVHRVVEVDNTVIVDQLAGVLAHILRPIDASVRINPADRPLLEQTLPELLTQFHQLKHVHLVDDPSIGAGGCVVSFGQGQIDATIDKQLARLVQAMIPGGTEVAEHVEQRRDDSSATDQSPTEPAAEPHDGSDD